MTFRTYHEESMHVIEAPEGSKVVFEGDRLGELVLFETMPGGMTVERRLPASVVIKAARRGFLGLTILEARSPWFHPEVALPCRAG